VSNRGIAEIQYANILMSARHSSLNIAAGYIRDSATSLAVQSKEQFSTLHAVGRWESIHLSTASLGQSLSAYSHFYKKELWNLAEYYVTKKFKVPTDGSLSIKGILNAVLAVQPTTDVLQKLYSKFENDCNPRQCQEFKEQLDKVVRQISNEVRSRALDYIDLPEEVKDTVREHLKRKQADGTSTDSTVSSGRKKKPSTTSTGSTVAHASARTGTDTDTGTSTAAVPVLPVVVPKTNAASASTTPLEVEVPESTGTENEDDDRKLPALQYYQKVVKPRGYDNTETLDFYRQTYTRTKKNAERIKVQAKNRIEGNAPQKRELNVKRL
jgi:hypothetical protein